MATKRGTRHLDVLSRKIWTAQELQGIDVISPTMHLAVLFFLNRHADGRVFLFVHGGPDVRSKKTR